MPRVVLATDAEGNARVFTYPSPASDSVDDERDDAQDVCAVPRQVHEEEKLLEQPSDEESGRPLAHAAVSAGASAAAADVAATTGAEGTVERQAVSLDDMDNEHREGRCGVVDMPAMDDGFVLVPRGGVGAALRAPQQLEAVSTPQQYWAARGFSPLVALALEECQVSPAEVEPGAPQDELGVLATAQSFFGGTSAAVTSWVAAAYGRSMTARVVQTTHVESEPGAACVAGGPSGGRVRRCGGAAAGAAAQAACVVASGERTAQQVEREKVLKQAGLLLDMLPAECMHKAFGFSDEEWRRVPQRRREALIQAHLGTFSEGALRCCRLALGRLRKWLVANFFPEAAEHFKCSGGLLAWWVQEEQAKSRSKTGGPTVPNSLRNGCVFAARNLALPLEVDASVFKNIGAAPSKTPVPALSATVAILYHFVALGDSRVALVRLYASGVVLSMLAALRLRDAQRASVEFREGYLVGSCFSSKHPKRRQPVVMPFFSPSEFEGRGFAEPLRSECPKGPDYLFPALRVPRGADILHPAASRLNYPAKTSDVIKVMRFLLTQAPLRLAPGQAARYSGHSLRHLMPTLARLFGFPKEERDELARWAPTPEGRGQRRSMSNMYAQEAECGRVLAIVKKLLDRLSATVWRLGGPTALPAQGGWHLFDTPESGVDLVGLTEAGAEPSSSEEDSDEG